MKVVRLSGLRTGLLYRPGNIPGTCLSEKLIRPQGHSAGRKDYVNKNTIGNRTRDLPACSLVPQLITPLRGIVVVVVVVVVVVLAIKRNSKC